MWKSQLKTVIMLALYLLFMYAKLLSKIICAFFLYFGTLTLITLYNFFCNKQSMYVILILFYCF